MFDFLKVSRSWDNKKARYVYTPHFIIKSTIKDLMIRSRDFYALYDESTGFWIEDESKAIEMIDDQVRSFAKEDAGESINDDEHGPIVKLLADTENRLIAQWHTYCQKDLRDTWHPLNQKLIFSNQVPKRTDYATRQLDYPLEEGSTAFYDKLCSTWYLPDEQKKWEWFVGCCIAGHATEIQKALIFFGEPGTGKSSVAEKIIGEQIFGGSVDNGGFTGSFEATVLAESKDSFGTDFLESDPVIAIDGEAKMTVVNAKGTFNKIISHEPVRVNAKFKATFYIKPTCLLIMCANDPVQIDQNSGLRRRIIDIEPTGNLVDADTYDYCMAQIPFERSGIAWKCLQVYKKLGKSYYSDYICEDMMRRTSPFQNFVLENYEQLENGVTLTTAYDLYKQYAEMCNFKNALPRYRFRDTLRLYFSNYTNFKFTGFKYDKIGMESPGTESENEPEKLPGLEDWLNLTDISSRFDSEFKDCLAQTEQDDPQHPLKYKWENCKTHLADISTRETHYVRVPENLIVIDLDLKDTEGEKSLERNLQAARNFPPTYAETSKSGQGLHLHYWYTGDVNKLSRIFAPNIEIKVFTGLSALRRKLTKCNDIPIASLSSGLPLQKEVKVVDSAGFENETKLKATIRNTLDFKYKEKGIVSHKQSIDFIAKLLLEAYSSGETYDISDMEQEIIGFAMQSTNNRPYCLERVAKMHFRSDDIVDNEVADEAAVDKEEFDKRPLIVLDIEIYPSYDQWVNKDDSVPEGTPALFFIAWKLYGPNHKMNYEFNPSPKTVRSLWEKYRFMGYNNRDYDNQMLWKAAQGATPEELYNYSGMLINKKGKVNVRNPQANNISWTDIFDLLSAGNKKGLKKWEIRLQREGKLVKHVEWSQPWDKPVPKELYDKVAEYCGNDVIAAEAVYDYNLHGDVLAREILSTLARPYGGTMNTTTNTLTNMIVFEGERHPGLVYTDFTTGKQYGPGEPFSMPIISWDEYVALGDDWTGVTPVNNNHFPGYHLVRFEDGTLHNMMMGIDVGFGGYVYAAPGMYGPSLTKDVASMHPHSIAALNLFDKYTQNYIDLMNARVYIKHGDYEAAGKLFKGAMLPYLTNKDDAKGLSGALKTALNSAYGLTSASFDNPMRDPRNINNIVALRGALVMRTLQEEVTKRGFKVIHIKTDSIKIANPTADILKFIDEFGEYYGYEFEVEHTWEKLCLVNESVFIGRHGLDDPDYVADPEKSEKKFPNRWEATGTQFAVPYVFKSLFTHQPIDFYDKCVTVNVNVGSLNLVYDEGTDNENDIFIGRVGLFCPMKTHGAPLYTFKEGSRTSPAGTKGYIWAEADKVEGVLENDINDDYFRTLCDKAVATISKYGDFNSFAETI